MNTASSPLSPVPEELVVRDRPKYLRTVLIYLVLIDPALFRFTKRAVH